MKEIQIFGDEINVDFTPTKFFEIYGVMPAQESGNKELDEMARESGIAPLPKDITLLFNSKLPNVKDLVKRRLEKNESQRLYEMEFVNYPNPQDFQFEGKEIILDSPEFREIDYNPTYKIQDIEVPQIQSISNYQLPFQDLASIYRTQRSFGYGLESKIGSYQPYYRRRY